MSRPAGVLALLLAAAVPVAARSAVPPRVSVTATVQVGGQPIGLAAGAASIWVANYGSNELDRIDPARMAVTKRIRLSGAPYGVSVGAGGVWVSSFDSRKVTRIDPGTGRIVATIDVGSTEQAGLLATGAGVWVAVWGASTLVRIDPATNAVTRRIRLGGNPEDVVAWRGKLWVPTRTGRSHGSILRWAG